MLYIQEFVGVRHVSRGFWTLCIEVQFYIGLILVFGIAQRMPWRRAVSSALLLAPIALVSLLIYRLGIRHSTDSILLASGTTLLPNFWVFYLGIAAWWCWSDRLPAAVFWVALVVAAVAVPTFPEKLIFPGIAAVSAAALIYIAGRTGKMTTWLNWSWVQYLGKVSYSLYLLHWPVGWVAIRICDHSPYKYGPVTLAIALASSIAAAHLLYTFVEKPSVRLSKFLKPQRQTAGTS